MHHPDIWQLSLPGCCAMDVKTVCLGMLTEGEASGYDLKKHFERSVGHFWSESYGRIYPMLAQLVSSYDIKQDWQLLAALGIPVGPAGTEFGGIESGVPGKTFSTGLNLFAQLAWYF